MPSLGGGPGAARADTGVVKAESDNPRPFGAWDEAEFDTLVANVPGAVYRGAFVDCGNRFDEMNLSNWVTLFMSSGVELVCGYPASDFVGDPAIRTFERVVHADDRVAVDESVRAAVASREPYELKYRVLHLDGGVRWVHERGRGVYDGDGGLLFLDGAILDCTEQKGLEEQLEHLAYHDSLTGLPNRALFREHVELALARAQRTACSAAVLFVDLDDFKLVNDSFGHQIGDQLLCTVADRLRDAARASDVIARQGGDEFLLLLTDLPPSDAAGAATVAASGIAGRIGEALEAPIRLGGVDVQVSASIGISIYPADGTDAEVLLKHADVAMYQSKDNGRNGYAFYADDGEAAMTRLSMAGRLARATENDEFVLHYQPLVELKSSRIVGVEALIRWCDPRGDLVPPAEFIPLAERTGLIGKISEWVIADACRQSAEWYRQGLDLYVSINLPSRFWEPTAMRGVLGTIESFGLSPGRLMVEITESTAMLNPARNEAIISELRERGLRVAIDDFGTGHSSLSRLNQMLVTMLKIDRSFIADLPGDANASVLVTAIINLANSLGLQPLAEGIETTEQRDFLIEQGCQFGQGYYFSRPIPAQQIPAFIAENQLRAKAA